MSVFDTMDHKGPRSESCRSAGGIIMGKYDCPGPRTGEIGAWKYRCPTCKKMHFLASGVGQAHKSEQALRPEVKYGETKAQ